MPPAVIRVQKGRAFLFSRLKYKKKREAECFNLLDRLQKTIVQRRRRRRRLTGGQTTPTTFQGLVDKKIKRKKKTIPSLTVVAKGRPIVSLLHRCC
jgi:hypothetical protein